MADKYLKLSCWIVYCQTDIRAKAKSSHLNSNRPKALNYIVLEAYSTRQEKVGKLLQKELAELFRREAGMFNNALITVTKVRISPDLSYAKVFLSIFIPGGDTKVILKGIEKQNPQIRFAIGKLIKKQVRIIPEFAFFIDDSLDYIDRIEQLLK